VALYVASDAGLFIASGQARGLPSREVLMLLSALGSLLIGVTASAGARGMSGLLDAVEPRNWIPVLPVAGCFALATWGQLHAITLLSPVFVKVLLQLKLPATVLLSAVLLGRHYTFLQVQALATVFLAVLGFMCLRVQNLSDVFVPGVQAGFDAALAGFLFSGLAIISNVFASLLAEKAFKTNKDQPCYTTVAHLKLGEACVAFGLLAALPPYTLEAMLQEPLAVIRRFDGSAYRLLGMMVLDSWMGALVVKRLDSVVKAVAKCGSLILIYFVSLATGKSENFHLAELILALLMANGTSLFAYVRKGEEA